MFERFTERARAVVTFAQEEARGLKHNFIGTEHLLLGLLREEEGLAAQTLSSLDVTLERVRARVVGIVGAGEEINVDQLPITPRARKVLELALREALSLGHNYIGTEHILLGLVREHDGVGMRILLDFDADSEKIRNEVIRRLSGIRAPQPPGAGREDPRASVQRVDVDHIQVHLMATVCGRGLAITISEQEAHELYEDLGALLARHFSDAELDEITREVSRRIGRRATLQARTVP